MLRVLRLPNQWVLGLGRGKVRSRDFSRQEGEAAIPENACRPLGAETRFSRGFRAKRSLPNQQDLLSNADRQRRHRERLKDLGSV